MTRRHSSIGLQIWRIILSAIEFPLCVLLKRLLSCRFQKEQRAKKERNILLSRLLQILITSTTDCFAPTFLLIHKWANSNLVNAVSMLKLLSASVTVVLGLL